MNTVNKLHTHPWSLDMQVEVSRRRTFQTAVLPEPVPHEPFQLGVLAHRHQALRSTGQPTAFGMIGQSLTTVHTKARAMKLATRPGVQQRRSSLARHQGLAQDPN